MSEPLGWRRSVSRRGARGIGLATAKAFAAKGSRVFIGDLDAELAAKEAMRADERNARALAERLHDGPLQDLLAARLELDAVRERHTDAGLDAAYQAVQDTAVQLRGTVTALHPQVLTEVGLTAALRELAPNGVIYHQKTITVDDTTAAVGTGNLTPQYYSTSRDARVLDTAPPPIPRYPSSAIGFTAFG